MSVTGTTRTRKHRTIPTWAIVTVGGAATIGAVLWASGLHDDTGNELLDGPAASVIIGVLGFLGTVLTLLLQRTGDVRHQVRNSHTENLRDDLDGKHDALIRAFEGLSADIRGVRRDIGRNTDRIERIDQKVDKVIGRVDDIEDTVDTRHRNEGNPS